MFKLHRIKQAALHRTQGQQRVLVVGGSSVLFGIDAAAVQRRIGRPTVNLGMTAGLGGLFLLGYAEQSAQSGDVLVLSLEPNLFGEAPGVTDGGGQFSVLIGSPKVSSGSAFIPMKAPVSTNLGKVLRAGNPGLLMLVNDQTRRLLGLTAFRYQDSGVDDLGFSYGKVVAPYEPIQGIPAFDPEWTRVLSHFRAHMEKKGVIVVYSVPWIHVGPLHKARIERELQACLAKVELSIPVLESPSDAISLDTRLFSDTPLHLSEIGAQMRSERLATSLQQVLSQQKPISTPRLPAKAHHSAP